jgi:hypothetical protein
MFPEGLRFGTGLVQQPVQIVASHDLTLFVIGQGLKDQFGITGAVFRKQDRF